MPTKQFAQPAEEIASYILFVFEVLEEEDRSLPFSEAVSIVRHNAWLHSRRPVTFIEHMLELLVELGMAEIVEIPHPLKGIAPQRGLRVIPEGDLNLDLTKVEEIDLRDFARQLDVRRQERLVARQAIHRQRHFDRLDQRLRSIERQCVRWELALDAACTRESAVRMKYQPIGVLTRLGASNLNNAVTAVARCAIKLEELGKLREVVCEEILALKS